MDHALCELSKCKMAEMLKPEEEQATKLFLERINYIRNVKSEAPICWKTALKFLMARKFDVERAIILCEEHEEIRIREGIQHIDPLETVVRRELCSDKLTILSKRDSNGAAIALFTARLHQPQFSSHSAVLKGLIYQLDYALESSETQRNGLVFIYDMSDSKFQNFDYDLSIKILTLLKGGYPARLKKVLIVTAPLWFKAPFKFLRLFVREKLRDRVYTVNMSQLPMHIPVDSLPRRLGGNLEWCHKQWLSLCLEDTLGKNSENTIRAYFENNDKLLVDGIAKNMCNISTTTTTPNGSIPTPGDTTPSVTSDLDSEGSKETVQEKYDDEDREKEVTVEKDDNKQVLSNAIPVTVANLNEQEKDLIKDHPNPPCKRGSDFSPTQNSNENGTDILSLPCKRRPTSYDSSQSIHHSEPGGYTVEELIECVRIKKQKGLYREYIAIKQEPPLGTFDVSRARYNLPKNRYTDVLCLDHSRVMLSKQDDDPSSDYINANFVDGYNQKNAYISMQGPLPRTFADMWRMVWEQEILVIVMTTRTVERSRIKCGQYWPNEEKDQIESYGHFEVTNQGMEKTSDYVITTLLLRNTATNEVREVTHFQFISWPDYGVPQSAEAFLDFMFHVRSKQAERVKELGTSWDGHELGPPVLIHCSAGIGRTGTFITMDICTRRLADIGTVDVEVSVRRIRSQRAFSIQMPDQYVFCHLALIEHAQREGLLGDVTLEGFYDSDSDTE